MKLKDADALKEIFKQRERWHFTGIIATIDDSPTIDAVEVVRCKDCKYSIPNDGKLNDGARYCTIAFRERSKEPIAVWDLDYCSNGTREEVQDERGL